MRGERARTERGIEATSREIKTDLEADNPLSEFAIISYTGERRGGNGSYKMEQLERDEVQVGCGVPQAETKRENNTPLDIMLLPFGSDHIRIRDGLKNG